MIMDEFYDEDDFVDAKAHNKLLNEVSNLSRVQHIKPPTRTEPTLQFDEFSLVKNDDNDKHVPIKVKDIVRVLEKTSCADVAKEFQILHKTKKVLLAPLDKPIEDRINRKIGYQKAKKQLGRWNGVVTRLRNADCQVFPLKRENALIEKSAKNKPKYCIKNELMIQFEKIDKHFEGERKENDEKDVEEPDKIMNGTVSKEELAARRRELLYLKLKQSQKSAKEYKRNKIKSKRYHKLLKRQKIKEQIDEFERLQKTDPKAAEEKLRLIEKNRVLERASLRHKNTGLWAKNNQIKAKYNTDIRKDLADQLAISRQLTEKKAIPENDDDWFQNERMVETEIKKSNIGLPNPWVQSKTSEIVEQKENENSDVAEECNSKNEKEEDTKKRKVKNRMKKSKVISTSEWIVEETDPVGVTNMSVDDIFDLSDNIPFTKVSKKQFKTKRHLSPSATNESQFTAEVSGKRSKMDCIVSASKVENVRNIDSKIVPEVEPTNLQNDICDISIAEDLPEDAVFDKQLAMTEAFEDDEIIKDFNKEKEDITASKLAGQELNLSMTGWGSWAGGGINNDFSKRKQLKLKFENEQQTKPDKKYDRIIQLNEMNSKLKQHLVSDIPFPFTSVQDYEASIRAPIGRTFIPETATRLLTKPKVIIRSGQIINPIDESELSEVPGKKNIFIS